MTNKKKNPLKNIDDFLKQEASSLVTPEKVGSSEQSTSQDDAAKPEESTKPEAKEAITQNSILEMLFELKNQQGEDAFTKKFYEIVLETAENLDDSNPKKNLLINTMLYMQGGDNWKQSIKTYWERHP